MQDGKYRGLVTKSSGCLDKLESRRKIRNEQVIKSVKVASGAKRITHKKLWYRHVRRREEGQVLSRMADATIPGKRRKGRQKTRWKDSCNRYGKCGVEFRGRKVEDKVEERQIQSYAGDPDDKKSSRRRRRM